MRSTPALSFDLVGEMVVGSPAQAPCGIMAARGPLAPWVRWPAHVLITGWWNPARLELAAKVARRAFDVLKKTLADVKCGVSTMKQGF